MEIIIYFKDIDTPDTIVRKRPEIFELEYTSKDNPSWIKTKPNSPYEREYYFGEGNNCLFRITAEEAEALLFAWGIEI